MSRNYSVDLIGVNYGWVRIKVNSEPITLSRGQVGLLFLFNFVPELTRSEVREYFDKIGVKLSERPNVAHASLSRMIRLLKERELIIERNELLYQTFKGRAALLGVIHHLAERARTAGVDLADVSPWVTMFQSRP